MSYGWDHGWQMYGCQFPGWETLRLTDTSPAQSWVEPVSKDEALKFIELEYGSLPDPKQDAELDLMISAARAAAEQVQNRDLVRKQWDLYLDQFPHPGYATGAYGGGWYSGGSQIILRDRLVSVDLIEYTDSTGTTLPLVAGTDYIVDAKKQTPLVMPAFGKTWPSFTPYPSSAVMIRFTAGMPYGDNPWWKGNGAIVKRGMLYLIGHWFDNRLAWTRDIGNIQEFPWTVTDCLSSGAQIRRSF